ncbi:MAG: baseplate J/gp47 family protein [Pseudomonadota bacterium]
MPASIASSTAIDLSRLPPPQIIAQRVYEDILADLQADFLARFPAYSAALESDPVQKILEISAYRELVLRADFNLRARGTLIAYATGADLDNLAALYAVERLTITAADPGSGTPAVLESDDALRARVLLAPDSFTVAGPASAYVFHALSASGDVLDASAVSPTPGHVVVAVLARPTEEEPSGEASPELIAIVDAALSADTVRPLTDLVTVQSAAVTAFSVTAQLHVFAGPDRNLILATAIASLQAWLDENRRLGRDVPRSALIAALHVGGVQRVDLTEPLLDLVFDATEAGWAEEIAITIAGIGE